MASGLIVGGDSTQDARQVLTHTLSDKGRPGVHVGVLLGHLLPARPPGPPAIFHVLPLGGWWDVSVLPCGRDFNNNLSHLTRFSSSVAGFMGQCTVWYNCWQR